LTDFTSKVIDAMDIVNENDPNFESSTKVKRDVHDMISRYKEILQEKTLQTRPLDLDAFIKKKPDNYSEK
jgi:hypothetical protein